MHQSGRRPLSKVPAVTFSLNHCVFLFINSLVLRIFAHIGYYSPRSKEPEGDEMSSGPGTIPVNYSGAADDEMVMGVPAGMLSEIIAALKVVIAAPGPK